jgi:hypothetical protein
MVCALLDVKTCQRTRGISPWRIITYIDAYNWFNTFLDFICILVSCPKTCIVCTGLGIAHKAAPLTRDAAGLFCLGLQRSYSPHAPRLSRTRSWK